MLELVCTWRGLFNLLIDFNCGSRAGSPVSVVCDGEIPEGDPTDLALGACGGRSEKSPLAPQAENALEPAPRHPVLLQDLTAPEGTMLAEQLAGVCGQWGVTQPTLPFSSVVVAAFSAPRFSGPTFWTPVATPSLPAQASAAPRVPGWTPLADVAPDSAVHASAMLRMPRCGSLPSVASDCSAEAQNQAVDLLIWHLPLLTELPNVSQQLVELLSLQMQLLQLPETPHRTGLAGPAPPVRVAPNPEPTAVVMVSATSAAPASLLPAKLRPAKEVAVTAAVPRLAVAPGVTAAPNTAAADQALDA